MTLAERARYGFQIVYRLFLEFLVPLILAFLWTAFDKNAVDFQRQLTTFAGALFFFFWGVSQYLRVHKQVKLDKGITGIEERVEAVIETLEKHTRDFIGYSTGIGSKAYFQPFAHDTSVSFLLCHEGPYPVFDFEAILQIWGDFSQTPTFTASSVFPQTGHHTPHPFIIDMKDRLAWAGSIVIQSRPIGIVQVFLVLKTEAGIIIAEKRTSWIPGSGESVREYFIPEGFPGADPDYPDALFKYPFQGHME